MKCSNCPLYMGWSIESNNGIEDNGVSCGLFGDNWNSRFQYEKEGYVVGCYIDRHFIEVQAKTVKDKIKKKLNNDRTWYMKGYIDNEVD